MVLTFERNRGERERLSDIFIVIMSFRRRVALLACQLPELLFCFYRGHGIIGNSASVPLKPFSVKKKKRRKNTLEPFSFSILLSKTCLMFWLYFKYDKAVIMCIFVLGYAYILAVKLTEKEKIVKE